MSKYKTYIAQTKISEHSLWWEALTYVVRAKSISEVKKIIKNDWRGLIVTKITEMEQRPKLKRVIFSEFSGEKIRGNDD